MAQNIQTAQIIKIEGNKIIFNSDIFKMIINENSKCHNLPVAIIIINGALRTGKSFFSNFIIRHLLDLENSEHTYPNTLIDYFTSRRGSSVETLGVWMLNKIFIHNEKAIILMDTQGLFDQELDHILTIILMSISTVLSSYQILNIDKRIQEDHLTHIAHFSTYANLLTTQLMSDEHRTGQTLCLLVRDWQNYENSFDIEKCMIEADEYKNEFLHDTKNLEKLDTRKKIFDTYENVTVKLCPHPGHLVTEGKFSGNISEIREDFRLHVNHIIDDVLETIKPKRINDNFLLCADLPEYMTRCVMLHENVRESLPKSISTLEGTEKIFNDDIVTKTLQHYQALLKNRTKTSDISVSIHDLCVQETRCYFNKLYVMGDNKEKIIKNKKLLLDCINENLEKEKNNIQKEIKSVYKDSFNYRLLMLLFISYLYCSNLINDNENSRICIMFIAYVSCVINIFRE